MGLSHVLIRLVVEMGASGGLSVPNAAKGLRVALTKATGHPHVQRAMRPATCGCESRRGRGRIVRASGQGRVIYRVRIPSRKAADAGKQGGPHCEVWGLCIKK